MFGPLWHYADSTFLTHRIDNIDRHRRSRDCPRVSDWDGHSFQFHGEILSYYFARSLFPCELRYRSNRLPIVPYAHHNSPFRLIPKMRGSPVFCGIAENFPRSSHRQCQFDFSGFALAKLRNNSSLLNAAALRRLQSIPSTLFVPRSRR